ncbi:exo-beta-N-acetylmuramidase NamZ domain-containing protein [Prosthecochloris sp. HL-130-GSB]|jgi:uncharacterized protein YbbC (DUF1343 family)|uniref:exo-beta-N-acetylmuramidase NamZ family protein n=1 Tax=Prosthecochloris sp. HL-130-GSB TaxID=1974213 RepID=UPI000A1C10D5|nr:DUF1343 domain-containing protein [Prosthecochloris sp. HL-130-GSB]ARM30169.1 hypothetical protein B9H02_01045 [Prosthecochloris sp. HL-130-GSB]MBO8091763.1 DUF1343 domain-containing protein [Prosthecochloris sp.]
MAVVTGLDRLTENPDMLKGRSVALIANQTSVTSGFRYAWNELPARGIRLERVFSPEHGLFSTEQDQVAVIQQPETACEIISLYGSSAGSLLPAQELLEDIDTVLFDIQDIGTRYYTYVNTLALFMEQLDGTGKELIVLDRPNPLGGIRVEGPLPDPAYRSFVGVLPVPVRHAMTAGELAHLYRDYKKLDIDLHVIPMLGWQRSMDFTATGLPWIPPSPNMPTPQTALVYPGMCLFEGLNCSEARGTTTPFLQFGAPFIDPFLLADHHALSYARGITFRPTFFRPSFHKYTGDICGGLYLHVTNPALFDSFLTGIALTSALHDIYPGKLMFLDEVYEFNDTYPAFDLLCGSPDLRNMICGECPMDEIIRSWKNDEAEFIPLKETYHIY